MRREYREPAGPGRHPGGQLALEEPGRPSREEPEARRPLEDHPCPAIELDFGEPPGQVQVLAGRISRPGRWSGPSHRQSWALTNHATFSSAGSLAIGGGRSPIEPRARAPIPARNHRRGRRDQCRQTHPPARQNQAVFDGLGPRPHPRREFDPRRPTVPAARRSPVRRGSRNGSRCGAGSIRRNGDAPRSCPACRLRAGPARLVDQARAILVHQVEELGGEIASSVAIHAIPPCARDRRTQSNNAGGSA